MFKKIDKALSYMQTITSILFMLLGIAVLLGGAFVLEIGIQFSLLVWGIGALLVWLAWITNNLILSFLCDIKLIRNKLYNQDNKDLAYLLEDDQPTNSEA